MELFNSSDDAGLGITDANGRFSINPQKYATVTDFEIYFEKEGYIANAIVVGVDTLATSGNAN